MATTLSTRNGNIGMNLPTTTTSARLKNPSHSKECSNCGGHTPFFLHQVKHQGNFRRLCTACVLRTHRSSFCPVCLVFYGGSRPPASQQVPCSNCNSIAHSHCASGNLLTSYLCPPCKESNFSFFPIKNNRIDKKLALALLCAAKIAASSMANAARVARAEQDRLVMESRRARKRAEEAVQHVIALTIPARKASEYLDLVKVDDLDLDNGDDEGDGDLDVDLVRHIEDSLVDVDD